MTEAILLDQNFGDVHHRRGLAYKEMGEQAKANEDFAQAKKLWGKPMM